jgi:hypothetical protein
VQDHPLVGPAHHAPGALEQIGRRNALAAEAVDDGVVEAAEGEVELSHHDIGRQRVPSASMERGRNVWGSESCSLGARERLPTTQPL